MSGRGGVAPSRGARWARALGLLVAVVSLLLARAAAAHAVGMSTGEYRELEGDGGPRALGVRIVLARGELLSLVPSLDADHDGALTQPELARGLDAARPTLAHLAVVRGGAPCAGSLEALALTEQDGVTLEARFSCPATGTTYKVRFGLFDDLARGHRHIARELGGGAREDILFGGHDTFEVSSVSATPGAPEPTSHAAPATFPGFLRLGVEHILTGYDHLVFLFGLVLVRSRPRALLAVVTAFTVAHSLTLGLATLGVWAPSPRFVEPAIALSIAYVGVENLLVKDANRRWRITFPFGLVHGFGFAGALREVELPRARIPLALVGFNVGVELAQIAALAVLVPLVLLVSRRHTVPRVTQALSVLVAVAGLAWFIARVVAG
ncbi:MAG TPA: HupE/UreJ family protein [Polyangiaceae bacterium]|nr:HupE/UreJ family protein [Polyangiaceae bacterium]